MREAKDGVLRMGSMVEIQIRKALEALVAHDEAAATAVIIGDRRINEVQVDVSNVITTAIATQGPVARDLRFLLTLDHVTYELERMGDHAVIGRQAGSQAGALPAAQGLRRPAAPGVAASPTRSEASSMRWSTSTSSAPATVAAADDEIDTLYHRIFDHVVELMRQDPDNVDRGTRILFAAHYLERIGDRVTNIAEDIVFLASGQIEDLNP